MADINYTSLLGLALPVTGRLQGLWGDVVNTQITQLLEDAVAGTATQDISAGDWTLTTSAAGSASQAGKAILIPTGTAGVARNIIAPATSKAYFVINKSDAVVTIKATGTVGVEFKSGVAGIVIWDGTDFVGVSGSGGADLEYKDANFTAEIGGYYYLDGAITATLPDTTNADIGDSVTSIKTLSSTPVIEVGAGGASIVSERATDTSVVFDVNARIVLVFNGTDWEV